MAKAATKAKTASAPKERNSAQVRLDKAMRPSAEIKGDLQPLEEGRRGLEECMRDLMECRAQWQACIDRLNGPEPGDLRAAIGGKLFRNRSRF